MLEIEGPKKEPILVPGGLLRLALVALILVGSNAAYHAIFAALH